jgi:hypothetical protein
LTAEGTTSKGTGSISCEVEFCIFYRLSLRPLRRKDVIIIIIICIVYVQVCTIYEEAAIGLISLTLPISYRNIAFDLHVFSDEYNKGINLEITKHVDL